MLHFPSSSAGRPLPKRTASLTNNKSSSPDLFAAIEDDLHDARRVHTHGQEEDLRLALSMVISRVSELSTLLKEAYKTQTELETSLNLAKSNLQLVSANNEMLEEALKRNDPPSSKDVGWRRWSAREGREFKERTIEEEERSKSIDLGRTNSAASSVQNSPNPSIQGKNETGSETCPSSPAPSSAQDNRFFKFRFSSSSSANTPLSTRSRSPVPLPISNGHHAAIHASHLTSSSLPSLVPPTVNKELEELSAQLEKEKAAHKVASDAKKALEAEIESLSQALFEEANKMVATERIKRAETEDELREAQLEKEALHSALRLVESENDRLRTTSVPDVSLALSHSRSSSRTAVKSPPPPERPRSPSPDPPSDPLPAEDGGARRRPPSLVLEERNSSSDTSPHTAIPSGDANQDQEQAEEEKWDPHSVAPSAFYEEEKSPWADSNPSNSTSKSESMFSAAAFRIR